MTDQKIIESIKTLLNTEQEKEIYNLTRKLKRALEQRDNWKEIATRYRKNLLEKK